VATGPGPFRRLGQRFGLFFADTLGGQAGVNRRPPGLARRQSLAKSPAHYLLRTPSFKHLLYGKWSHVRGSRSRSAEDSGATSGFAGHGRRLPFHGRWLL